MGSTMKFRYYVGIVVFLFAWIPFQTIHAQGKQSKYLSVVFYNVENLFDTIDDPNTDDSEFTPTGKDQWNTQRYRQKLKRVAEVLSKIGNDSIQTGFPVIIGLAEVENRAVIEDLIKEPSLVKAGYRIVHVNSPDKRGIDVALLYQSSQFKFKSSKAIPLHVEGQPDFYTRDILRVDGELNGQMMHIFVNHWPSRSKGQAESEPLRIAAADLCRTSVNEVLRTNPDASIIVMGDLNDDPTDASVAQHFGYAQSTTTIASAGFYNPMWQLFADGKGTLEYKGKWNLFDQIIISQALVVPRRGGYLFVTAKIFKPEWLLEQDGKYKGTPFRSFAGTKYLGGYSDHLPVYLLLKKTK